MLVKTKGIVLGQIPFKESSLIIKIYTEELGTRGFIQSAAKKSTKKSKTAYFLPLSLLDMVVYHKPNRDLDTISEVKFAHTFQSIPFETSRSSIAIFLAELLNQVLKVEASDRDKFRFLETSIRSLDQPETPISDFPIRFILELSHYIGFGPSEFQDIENEMDLITPSDRAKAIIQSLMDGNSKPELGSGKDRKEVLEILLKFYSNHIENFRELNSLPILHTVLA